MSGKTSLDAFYPKGGLNVASYDLRADLDRKLFEDPIPFYCNQTRKLGGPVLELGCGTGRITSAIADLGIEVQGLDLSDAMLDEARKKRADIGWHHGNMCNFDLPEQFSLIIIPFRGLQEVTDAKEQRQCLECSFRHLRSGGRLIFDLIDPDLRYCLPEGDPEAVELPLFPMPDGVGYSDSRLRITALERLNTPLLQRFDEHWRFEEIAPDGKVLRAEDSWHSMRWVYRSEMRLMLELAGFGEIQEFSTFEFGAPAYGKNQIWLAQK